MPSAAGYPIARESDSATDSDDDSATDSATATDRDSENASASNSENASVSDSATESDSASGSDDDGVTDNAGDLAIFTTEEDGEPLRATEFVCIHTQVGAAQPGAIPK